MTPAFPLRRPVLALAIAFGVTPFALADESLPTVTISGARFAADPGFAPPGATIITATVVKTWWNSRSVRLQPLPAP